MTGTDSRPAPPVVILSTADFHSAVWTNKQHLAAGLAEVGHDVVYIESLGLRAPRLRLADARRMIAKLRSRPDSAVATRSLPPGLTVLTPRVLPWHRFRLVRAINRRLLERTIGRRLPVDPATVFWSFSPLSYGLGDRYAHRVYHCVDLLHEIDGIPARALLDGERATLASAHAVVASSRVVRDHLAAQGARDPLLWENVARTDLFSRARAVRRDRIVFAGNLTPSKIDFELLGDLLDRGLLLDLAGPVAIDGTAADAAMDHVLGHHGTRYLGLLGLEELAEAFARCKVGIIPYLRNPYTSGVFPMKVHEYLAAGLSVVATALPSLEGSDIPGLRVVADEHFATTVAAQLSDFDEEEAEARSASSRDHSWSRRIEQARELLGALQDGSVARVGR